MTTITSTEKGATGRYINFGSPAALTNLVNSATGFTVIAYIKSAVQSVLGYVVGKTDTSGNGFRFGVNTSGYIFFASCGTSGVSTAPNKIGGLVTNGSWQHIQATCSGNGSVLASSLNLYLDNSSALSDAATDGSGTASSDASNNLYILNRDGLGREFVGDVAYVAVWNRVLDSTERATVRSDGPLAVGSGLIFCYANDQDCSTNALSYTSRSTRVTGSTPTNTALGTLVSNQTLTPGLLTNAQTFYAPTVSQAGGGNQTLTPSLLTNGQTFYAPTVSVESFLIFDDYERSSVDLANSIVTGTGDDAIIAIHPRAAYSEIAYQYQWFEPSAKITGVNGFRPTFRFLEYKSGNYGVPVFPWASTRKMHYSYDRETWYPFDTTTRDAANGYVTFRHNTAFTQDTVYIGRSWQYSVHQAGEWLDTMAAAHPGVFNPSATALAYTPSGNVSGYAGQSFIANEFASRSNELGGTVPVTPLYGAEINDASLMPLDGTPKRWAVLSAGVHASEDLANYHMAAFVEYLLGSSANAQALRRQYRIAVYPMMNAPGRAGGHFRGAYFTSANVSTYGDDLNQHYHESSPVLDTVVKTKAAYNTDRNGKAPDWHLDFHCTYDGRWGVYTGGVGTQEVFRSRQQTNSGVTITDLLNGVPFVGTSTAFPGYSKTLGSKLSISWEMGDDSPQTWTDINNQVVAAHETLVSMMEDGYIFTSIQPGMLTNEQTFFAPEVTGGADVDYLSPGLLTNSQTFFAPTVTPGSVAIAPALFANQNVFYAPTIVVGSGGGVVTGEVTLSPATIEALAAAIANAIYAHPNAVTPNSIAASVWDKVIP